MNVPRLIELIRKELDIVRKEKVNRVKRRVRKGKYKVPNRDVALSLFWSP